MPNSGITNSSDYTRMCSLFTQECFIAVISDACVIGLFFLLQIVSVLGHKSCNILLAGAGISMLA
jgi:hypothetical protein